MDSKFSVAGRVAIVTGGGGVLGGRMAETLAGAGARVALVGRTRAKLDAVAARIAAQGGTAAAIDADVLDRAALERARDAILARLGEPTILVHAAGGNVPAATVGPTANVFDLGIEAFEDCVRLNLTGTVLPTLVFGPALVAAGGGSIVAISSMAAARPLTRVVAYSAAKSAVESFTRWLAVEAATKLGGRLRVNAIAPGFFVTEQNRRLLTEPDGTPTARGATVLAHTPLGRFGEPEDLDGVLLWLCSDAARFVTGIVVPVDGGFSAFAGV
ncbi:MAG: SDR family oxidoreductase [Planctomycetes bacterium]|nr:SDR family oxidoreductase [Planctomycetota bacterium]